MTKNSTTNEQVLKASTDSQTSNSKGRGRGRSRGRGKGDQGNREFSNNSRGNDDQIQSRGRGRGTSKSKVECCRCHKLGHYATECYSKFHADKARGESSNFVEGAEAETLLKAFHHKERVDVEIWYVDTGCSNHMSGSKSSFSTLDEDFHSSVRFGDSSTVKVMGKGDIQIKTKNGFVELISNVFYVPELKCNLLSAGQLQEKGYVITIGKGSCEIYDFAKGSIVVIPMSPNRLFPLRIETSQPCLMIEQKDPSWLWHFSIWAFEFWWSEDSSAEEYGDRTSYNITYFQSL